MTEDTGSRPSLVLAGAGHAHVIALRDFVTRAPDACVTIVTRDVLTPYSGTLPGVIAGHYPPGAAMIDIRPLAQSIGARLIQDEIVSLDAESRSFTCASGAKLAYDVLSIDIGSRPNTGDVPGAREGAIPVKPIDRLLGTFASVEQRFAERGYAARVAVVGGGAGGVELAFAINHRLRAIAVSAGAAEARIQVLVVAGSHGLLPGFSDGFRRRVRAALESRAVRLHEGRRVERVEDGRLFLDGGGLLEADETLWTTQAEAATWLASSGLATDEAGFVAVDETLRSTSHGNVFAAGDVASFSPMKLPKSGVYAVRQGPVLANNLRAALSNKELQTFKPQKHVLYILSTGDKNAIMTKYGMSLEGAPIWLLKHMIDNRFIKQFSTR
jgi:selenide, water dikinase